MTSPTSLPPEPDRDALEAHGMAELYYMQQDVEAEEGYRASFDHVASYLEDAFDPVREYWQEQGRDPGSCPDLSYSISDRGASYQPDLDGDGELEFGLPGDHPLELSIFDVYVHEAGHQYNQRQIEHHATAPKEAVVTNTKGEVLAGIDEGFMQLWTYHMVEDIGDQDERESFIMDRIHHYKNNSTDEELFAGVAMEISERMTEHTGTAEERFRTAYQEVEDEVLHEPETLPDYLEDPFSTDWIERLV